MRQICLSFFGRRFRSGGEENERQMANNVMQEMRFYDGYLVGLTALEILPATSGGCVGFVGERGNFKNFPTITQDLSR